MENYKETCINWRQNKKYLLQGPSQQGSSLAALGESEQDKMKCPVRCRAPPVIHTQSLQYDIIKSTNNRVTQSSEERSNRYRKAHLTLETKHNVQKIKISPTVSHQFIAWFKLKKKIDFQAVGETRERDAREQDF